MNELFRMQRADFGPGRGRIRIEQGKGKQDRIVPFPEHFKEALAIHRCVRPGSLGSRGGDPAHAVSSEAPRPADAAAWRRLRETLDQRHAARCAQLRFRRDAEPSPAPPPEAGLLRPVMPAEEDITRS